MKIRLKENATTRTIRVEDLPEDMQDLIHQYFEDSGYEITPVELPVRWMSLDKFPGAEFYPNDRGEEYAKDMIGATDLPPVVICKNKWLDGRHRVWAAKEEGKERVLAIDLSPWDINEPNAWDLI